MLELVARKVFRIGVQSLWFDGVDRYYVSIRNRSYSSLIEIPWSKALIWKEVLK